MAKKLACVIFEVDENESIGPESFKIENGGRALGHLEVPDVLTDPGETAVMFCMAVAHASHVAEMKNLSATFPAYKHEIPAADAALLAMIESEQPQSATLDASKFN